MRYSHLGLHLKHKFTNPLIGPSTGCNSSLSRHLISTVSAATNKASASEERSRAVGRESWGASVKASAVNSHHYKRRIVRSN